MANCYCCPICYKEGIGTGSQNGLDEGESRYDYGAAGSDGLRPVLVQQRFFKLLERFLVEGEKGVKSSTSFPFPLEELTKIGMLSCGECLQLMKSFCELYHQLKTVELLLNWKVGTLKNIMRGAQKVPSRMKYFRECVDKLEVEEISCSNWGSSDEIARAVIKSRKLIIQKCSKMLATSFPKLSVLRTPSSEEDRPDVVMIKMNSREKPDKIANVIPNIESVGEMESSPKFLAIVKTEVPDISENVTSLDVIVEEERVVHGNVVDCDHNPVMADKELTAPKRLPIQKTEQPFISENLASTAETDIGIDAKGTHQSVVTGKSMMASANFPNCSFLFAKNFHVAATPRRNSVRSEEETQTVHHPSPTETQVQPNAEPEHHIRKEQLLLGYNVAESDPPVAESESYSDVNQDCHVGIGKKKSKEIGEQLNQLPTTPTNIASPPIPDCNLLNEVRTGDDVNLNLDSSNAELERQNSEGQNSETVRENEEVVDALSLPTETSVANVESLDTPNTDFLLLAEEDPGSTDTEGIRLSAQPVELNASENVAAVIVNKPAKVHAISINENGPFLAVAEAENGTDGTHHPDTDVGEDMTSKVLEHCSFLIKKYMKATWWTSSFQKEEKLRQVKQEVEEKDNDNEKKKSSVIVIKVEECDDDMPVDAVANDCDSADLFNDTGQDVEVATKENPSEGTALQAIELTCSTPPIPVPPNPNLGQEGINSQDTSLTLDCANVNSEEPNNEKEEPATVNANGTDALPDLPDPIPPSLSVVNPALPLPELNRNVEMSPAPCETGSTAAAAISRRSSRLRIVHPCTKCNKTFSTQDKLLEHHQLSHEVDEDKRVSDSESESEYSEEDDDKDGSSSSSSDFTDDEQEVPSECETPDLKDNHVVVDNSKTQLQVVSMQPKLGAPSPGPTPEGNTNVVKTVKPTDLKLTGKATGREQNSSKTSSSKPKRRRTSEPELNITYYYCKANKFCFEIFDTKPDLEMHSKLHGKFSCFFCAAAHEYAPDLSRHEMTAHSTDDNALTKQDVAVWLNPKTNLFKRPLKCPRPDCPFNSENKLDYVDHHLADHMDLKQGRTTLTCEICHISFHSRRLGIKWKHLRGHFDLQHNLDNLKDGEQAQKCDQEDCQAYFLKPVQLRLHKLKVHNIKARYKCSTCNSTYKTSTQLSKHQLEFHPELLSQRCKQEGCHYRCETKHQLKVHIQVMHSGKRAGQIKCPLCDKLCLSDVGLKIHLKNHGSVARQPICELCGKAFKDRMVLQKHSLSHSGPESWEFQCSVCSKKCMDKYKLEEHMRTHTKEKPYVCELCGAKYAGRHNLRIHVNSKHGDKVQDLPRKFNKANLTSRKGIKRKRVSNMSDSDDDADD